ncbi:citrate/2-methylcitrate synthase [Cylindrospermopsis curvispora]|uniref:citrate synthase (unknown stereospecificity) n=1 Tax=Cylindrospermopsis curvispora GIHE-G1 TaxID=2666332 RepID=A0A7H0EYG5_9CYAN|nr:citrate/2-methylcitrate synthase [Cylindrospermopsis curvispora]QNP28831.1 citrate/2-methylcitrate synthase [Cylindrospermopsis curvispora GIHE-G1]
METRYLSITLPDASSYSIAVNFTQEGQGIISSETLAKETGLLTYDRYLKHTITELVTITHVDPKNLELYYRGFPISTVSHKCDFLDTVILLHKGTLPNQQEKQWLKKQLAENSILDRKIQKGLRQVISSFSHDTNAIAILSAGLSYLAAECPLPLRNETEQLQAVIKALALSPIIAAMIIQHCRQESFEFPENFGADGEDYDYAHNLLAMIHGANQVSSEQQTLMDKLLVIHADAGLAPSTFAGVQNISHGTSMWNALVSMVNALCGDRHGGANIRVLLMFDEIARLDGDLEQSLKTYIDKTIEQKNRIPGLGHIDFKGLDPRAKILAQICDKLINDSQGDTFMHIARKMHHLVDSMAQFDTVKPNIDFYSGLLWRTLGIPDMLMTVMFYCSRVAGCTAHFCMATHNKKIVFPNNFVAGSTGLSFDNNSQVVSYMSPLFNADL